VSEWAHGRQPVVGGETVAGNGKSRSGGGGPHSVMSLVAYQRLQRYVVNGASGRHLPTE
jgi:hypothetical protein